LQVTCCTKWSPTDRFSDDYPDWRFQFDHVFATGPFTVAKQPTLMPYAYPGTAAACIDAACTGEIPPENATATAQGSWHRGWQVDLLL
jgi:hypothetical protein